MRNQELIVFRNFEDGELFAEIIDIVERVQAGDGEESIRGRFFDCIRKLIDMAVTHGFHGNLWHCYLANLLVNHENGYSMGCELRGEIEGSINDAALHDMEIFREFFSYDFTPVMERTGCPQWKLAEYYEGNTIGGRIYNARISDRICTLAAKLAVSGSAEEMKEILTEFYREYGVGRFGLHKAFRVEGQEGRIVPILKIAHVKLDDLVGYEIAKKKLVDNTDAFVGGRKANNCLLFGDAGTGKSSSIKAIANEYYDRGLRVIEIYRHQIGEIHRVIEQIKNRNYKFILYMDDLSFEESETEYKYLKAVIEGGLERKPDNVLIYATSNRRHLIRENYGDREEIRQDMHTGDTVQEKLSLAYRFGVTIFFGSPDKRQYEHIVKVLAERYGVQLEEERLLEEANKWEMNHGGLSGRSAQQFIDYLLGSTGA